MNEWVRVPGYEFIEVTRSGSVRAAGHIVTRISRWGTEVSYTFKPREYRTWVDDNGYVRVVVQRNGKRGPIYVHRLLAFAFVDGYQSGYHVNHINGKKTDNDPENLEWVPNESNVRHAWRTGLTGRRGIDVWCAKLTPKQIRAIRRMLSKGVSANTIAIACKLSRTSISRIEQGIAWQHI